tara:strand:+ start:1148 stop:1606 length:459 start_codon:yes stop_codon:yes gene_type:complete
MDQVQIIGALQSIPLFADLDYQQITTFYEAGSLLQIEADEVLCEAETVDENLIIFLAGEMRIESSDGQQVAIIDKVRSIGEMGAFTGQALATYVVATQTSTVLVLASDVWGELLESDPGVGLKIQSGLLKILYARMHDMNEELRALRAEKEK